MTHIGQTWPILVKHVPYWSNMTHIGHRSAFALVCSMCIRLQLPAARSCTVAVWRTTRTRQSTLTVQDPLGRSLPTVNSTERPATLSSVCQLTHMLWASQQNNLPTPVTHMIAEKAVYYNISALYQLIILRLSDRPRIRERPYKMLLYSLLLDIWSPDCGTLTCAKRTYVSDAETKVKLEKLTQTCRPSLPEFQQRRKVIESLCFRNGAIYRNAKRTREAPLIVLHIQ